MNKLISLILLCLAFPAFAQKSGMLQNNRPGGGGNATATNLSGNALTQVTNIAQTLVDASTGPTNGVTASTVTNISRGLDNGISNYVDITSIGTNRFGSNATRIVFEGDSLTEGYPAVTAGLGYQWSNSFLRTWKSLTWGTNAAKTGEYLSDMLFSQYTNHVKPWRTAGGTNAVLALYAGLNDIASATPFEVYTNLSNYWALARADGFKVIAFTLPSRRDTTTLTERSATFELNKLIRQDPSLYDELCDAAVFFRGMRMTNTADGTHWDAVVNKSFAAFFDNSLRGYRVPAPLVDDQWWARGLLWGDSELGTNGSLAVHGNAADQSFDFTVRQGAAGFYDKTYWMASGGFSANAKATSTNQLKFENLYEDEWFSIYGDHVVAPLKFSAGTNSTAGALNVHGRRYWNGGSSNNAVASIIGRLSTGEEVETALPAGTNTLIQTNGTTLGSVGTINWTTGVTGSISGSVATLGISASGGGGGSATNAVALTNGLVYDSLTISNQYGTTGSALHFKDRLGNFIFTWLADSEDFDLEIGLFNQYAQVYNIEVHTNNWLKFNGNVITNNATVYNLSNVITLGTSSVVGVPGEARAEIAFSDTNGTQVAVFQGPATNSVVVTNQISRLHLASASVLTLNCNYSHAYTVTSRVSAATSVVITNSAEGQNIKASLIGEASGGTDRVITFIPNTGQLAANLDVFGTALATSYSFTLTNGNAVEVDDLVERQNGTNIHKFVSRQYKF